MTLQTIALFFLVTVAAGGVVWVFVYPLLTGEKKAEKRMASIAGEPGSRLAAASRNAQKSRREQVEESLKDLEARQRKAKRPPLSIRITQAGLDWSKRTYLIVSVVLGIVAFLAAMMANGGLIVALAAAFAFSFGLPRWLLSFLKKRRENIFLNAFPDGVDVIVRGVKAGLPLLDCLKIIVNEGQEPLKSEFKAIVETQTIGMPIGEACAKLYDRIPLPETNFFGIVILIQQRSGGNLSEALGNLSRVLRDRKRMKAKIRAMSMEAKASATIIAALPIAVMLLVYLTSPSYIELLWIRPLGRLMLACCAGWMFIGVLVMRKMINFDF